MSRPLIPLRAAGQRSAGVLNIAHRGARAYAPENTLEAFAKAEAFGCQMIEIDVHMATDGELIVHHDDQLTRCTNAKAKFPGRSSYYLSDFSSNELSMLDAGSWYVEQLELPVDQRQWPLQNITKKELDRYVGHKDMRHYASGQVRLPTLRETLEFARNAGMSVNIELKMIPRMYPHLTDAVVNLIEAMGMEPFVLVSSFDHEQLAVVRRHSDKIATAVLTGDRMACPAQYLQWLDADAYHPGTDTLGLASLRGELEPQGILDVLAAGRMVNVWTCNNTAEMRSLIDAGVTGLISDFPNRVSEALAK